MDRVEKIVLTTVDAIHLFYILPFAFPVEFKSIFPSMEAYNYQMVTLSILTISRIVYLLTKLWAFNNLDKGLRWEWTFFMLFFGTIAVPMFIWKKHDQFKCMNERLVQKK